MRENRERKIILCRRSKMKQRLRGFARGLLKLLEGMRKAEEEWAMLAFRGGSRQRKDGRGPWN